MDETYFKSKGQWKYLYRAVDKDGQTLDFLLTAHRDQKAALRFLKNAVRQHGLPDKVTLDQSGANTAALAALKEETGQVIEIRQNNSLNNRVEQDHRAVKRIVRPRLGFKSFHAFVAEIPKVGDHFDLVGYRFEVRDRDGLLTRKVLIIPVLMASPC